MTIHRLVIIALAVAVLAATVPSTVLATPLATTTIPLQEFQTAAFDGSVPATTAQFAGPLFVRQRSTPPDNPALPTRAFMNFDIAPLMGGGNVLSARLQLHANDKLNSVNTGNLYIAEVLQDWDSTSLDPSYSQLVDDAGEIFIGTNGTGGPAISIDYDVDVTSIVQGWVADPASNFGLRIRMDPGFVGTAFDDVGPLAPRLVVQHLVPEPSTMMMGLLGMVGVARVVRRRRSAA